MAFLTAAKTCFSVGCAAAFATALAGAAFAFAFAFAAELGWGFGREGVATFAATP